MNKILDYIWSVVIIGALAYVARLISLNQKQKKELLQHEYKEEKRKINDEISNNSDVKLIDDFNKLTSRKP